MMKWQQNAWDWPALYFWPECPQGAIAARFRCELKQDSCPPGWSLVSVQWYPNEAGLWDAVEDFWADPNLPLMFWVDGELVHEGTGLGSVSNAWAYDAAAVDRAWCQVKYLRPNGTYWTQNVSAADNELVLAAGGPLLCGLWAIDDIKPSWDDGYKPNDPIDPQHTELGNHEQEKPWYLDVFDQLPFVEPGQWGQPIQRGKAYPRLAQPECLTSITWTVTGAADYSAAWTGAIHKVAPTGVCPAICIQATNNTGDGAIIPKALYAGLFKQTPTSVGESFAFYDHTDGCPPPGRHSLVDEGGEPQAWMNYYKFTGHKPDKANQDQPTLHYVPGQNSYSIYRDYTLQLLDVSGREMRGTWVQERWTVLEAGPKWQVNYEFGLDGAGKSWKTTRMPVHVGDPPPDGVDIAPGSFWFDTIGYFGALNSFLYDDGIFYTGTHEYWAGTSWCPKVEYNGLNQFTFNLEGMPAAGHGLGVKTDTYDISIKTNDAYQVKKVGQ